MSNWTEPRDPIPPDHGETYAPDKDTVWNRPDRGDAGLYDAIRAKLDEADDRLAATAERLRGAA